MVRIKILMTCLLGLMVIIGFSLTPIAAEEESSSHAAAQVSKAIAEWKLMNNDDAPEKEIVYTSVLLTEAVASGSHTLNGLSAYIDSNQLPDLILQKDADFTNMLYKGNIQIRQNLQLKDAGAWDLSNKTIWINPTQFSNPKYGPNGTNLGEVLSHEMTHAQLDAISMQIYGQPLSRGSVFDTIGEIPAIQAHESFSKTLNVKFGAERKIAQEIGVQNYNPLDRYNASETQALQNIKIIKYNSNVGTVSPYGNAYTMGNISRMPNYSYKPPIYKIPSMQTGTAGSWNNIGKWNSNIGMGSYGTAVGKISTLPNYSPLPTKIPTYTSPTYKMPSYKPTSSSGIK